MGNIASLYSNIQSGGSGDIIEENKINLEDTLDFIASYYILTTDFKTLSNLHEKKYCDDLIVLTSEIINKYFSDLEVKRLAKRIESGVKSPEKLVYFKKSDIENMETSGSDNETKQSMCADIAKFYIKIAHLFSAIVTTINPEYVYKDAFGNVIKKSLAQKTDIPEDSNPTVSKINLCSERIKALNGGPIEDLSQFEENDESEDPTESGEQNEDVRGNDKDKIKIHPELCNVNLDKNEETKYLAEEPGINELLDLYFDSDYDFKTGKFMGMTLETEKQFQEDLKRFYLAFTDETEIPPDIKKFSDIKMRDYSKKKFCSSGKSVEVTGAYKDELFLKYATNLKSMIQSVNQKQEELLAIINKIFVYVLDPVTKKDVVRVNPDLTEDELQRLVVETRTIIIEMYLKCETDFLEGVKIYEAIVEGQILSTTQKHIEHLETEREKLISPYIETKGNNVN